ncbi:MAG: DNA-binding protein [Aquificae bacterium]|nr:DNA-binding protein [Aquificota bacterium]
MTKRELTRRLHESLLEQNVKVSKRELYDIVSEIFKILEESILEGKKVKISGFGTFTVKTRRPKKGMNLREMKLIEIPERKVVLFKPSRLFVKS